MKYLVVIGLVLVVLWIWRNNRRADINHANAKAARDDPHPSGEATEIVACDLCNVHLPRSEALTGPGGVYCSAAHRRQAGH